MQCSDTLYQFAKRTQITCGAVAKDNRLPFFGPLACGNREIASIADHISNIPLGELHLN
jgi:hypothetical protein